MGDVRRPWSEVRLEEIRRYPAVFAAYADFLHAVQHGERDAHPDRPMIAVARPEDVPMLANECEEHEYWGVHEMSDAWFEDVEPLPDDVNALLTRARRARAQQMPPARG